MLLTFLTHGLHKNEMGFPLELDAMLKISAFGKKECVRFKGLSVGFSRSLLMKPAGSVIASSFRSC